MTEAAAPAVGIVEQERSAAPKGEDESIGSGQIVSDAAAPLRFGGRPDSPRHGFFVGHDAEGVCGSPSVGHQRFARVGTEQRLPRCLGGAEDGWRIVIAQCDELGGRAAEERLGVWERVGHGKTAIALRSRRPPQFDVRAPCGGAEGESATGTAACADDRA